MSLVTLLEGIRSTARQHTDCAYRLFGAIEAKTYQQHDQCKRLTLREYVESSHS